MTAAGLSGDDAQAAETLTLFATYLGRVAGDLALIFMAYGGVYLAGGISSQIAPVLKSGAFRDAFDDKAPHDGDHEAHGDGDHHQERRGARRHRGVRARAVAVRRGARRAALAGIGGPSGRDPPRLGGRSAQGGGLCDA